MQYALLVHSKPGALEALSAQEYEQVHQEYLALRDEPAVTDGAALYAPSTATTVRVLGGEVLITDGPFADTKEYFAGYYLVEAADLDEATAIAARIPAARLGGSVEIRPVVPSGERVPR
jgi:hypothetical protein